MTTPDPFAAPWHRRSWDEFLERALPDLLAERLPLAGYQLDADDPSASTRRVHVFLSGADGDVENTYDIPRPDPEGVFHTDDGQIVCVAVAEAGVDLADADVRCCGDLALDWIAGRLRTAGPGECPADAYDARAWLPLDSWLQQFIMQPGLQPWDAVTVQWLQSNNWLDRHAHLRRVKIPDREEVMTAGHHGRVCVIETPEGPNVARVLSVARGAEIHDRRIHIVDDTPTARLGVTTGCIPFLEHNDVNRALMGANMMRQWLPPATHEPARIRTGLEPEVDGFWCGHDLLTAFITWDEGCFEDALVISETASHRLACPEPVTIGDKLSHRHGAKGVVSQVLPDADMPALPDGTHVEIICSLTGLPSRLSLGSLREAVMSRVAQARGTHLEVAPFSSPSEDDLRRTLVEAGLPEDGMEQLTLDGEPLDYRSSVGWVYWGCTVHLAREKLHAAADLEHVAPEKRRLVGPIAGDLLRYAPQHQGELEAAALREAEAVETIREHYNTRAVDRPDSDSLAARVASGAPLQAEPPSPQFSRLQTRLEVAGIRLQLDGGSMAVSLGPASTHTTALAEPTPHPWLPDHTIDHVGGLEESAAWTPLLEANRRLQRALSSHAPRALLDKTRSLLARRLAEYLDDLVGPADLQFQANVLFTARGVIAPGSDLHHDQIGVPEEIAWVLFAGLVAQRLGNCDAAASRSPEAVAALDEVMAENWVILHRPPALLPSNFIAFQPRRTGGSAILVHPLVTNWMNADFDGDQAALSLPITGAGQREARQRLSLVSHFGGGTDPGSRHGWLYHDAMWGLAHLARTAEGRRTIDETAGQPLCSEQSVLSTGAIARALGNDADAVDTRQRLMRLGFQKARRAGGSMGVFIGSDLELPPKPPADDIDALESYSAEVQAVLAAFTDFDDDALGPVRLAQQSGARGSLHQLSILVGANVGRYASPWSQREGQQPSAMFGLARSAWSGLQQVHRETAGWLSSPPVWARSVERKPQAAGGSAVGGVLSRARMSRRPGVVFARAALRNETDPLTDSVSRLWVGLPHVS